LRMHNMSRWFQFLGNSALALSVLFKRIKNINLQYCFMFDLYILNAVMINNLNHSGYYIYIYIYIPPVLIFRNSVSTHRVFLWVSYDSNNKRSNPCKGKRFFLPTMPRQALEPIWPPRHWVLGFFHGVKQPGLEALH
jgi:hypothetical protein